MTASEKEIYFDSECGILDEIDAELYSDPEKFDARYKTYKDAQMKFRHEYYQYVLPAAEKEAEDEFNGDLGKAYLEKINNAAPGELIEIQKNVAYNLELYEEWAVNYLSGGRAEIFSPGNISNKISITSLKELIFLTMLEKEISVALAK